MVLAPSLCAECGGEIHSRTGTNREYDRVAGTVRLIPDHIEVPTCDVCGETFWNTELIDQVEQALKRNA